MKRLLDGSRRFFLGVAFVSVMAGTGGLVGAIGGVMLVLLSHTVLGMSAGIVELMPISVGFGAAAALSLGILLMVRPSGWLVWQPGLVSSAPPASGSDSN